MSDPILPKTRKQIAAEYGVSPLTLARRLKNLELMMPSGNLLPAYQRLLYENLGYPSVVDASNYEDIPLPNLKTNRDGFQEDTDSNI